MNRLWLVTNPASGSTSSILTVSIEAAVQDAGCIFAGRTGLPKEALPTAGKLEDAAVDTLVLFAGDGTLNATLGALGAWRGSFLILPGGTMNLLAKPLHDTLDPVAIVKAALSLRRRASLPIVKAGQHRAYVGVIIGPGTEWAHAREAIRKWRLARVWRAARVAWRRTFFRASAYVASRNCRVGIRRSSSAPAIGASVSRPSTLATGRP